MLLSIAENFIKRPVLATVATTLIVLSGLIAIPLLPIAQLPQLANTQIQVRSSYIGADAQTTETTVTAILERDINGVDGMRYISSNTGNNGLSNITVAFPTDIDRDIAQVNVQNKVAQAEAKLPDAVKQTGVTVQAASPNILLAFGFYSEKDADGKYYYDPLFISNYIDLNIYDQLKRLPGVGDISLFGERKYAMRLWLNPQLLAGRGLVAQDVINALREQNIQAGAGKVGQAPAPPNQEFEIPLQAVSRLRTAEEFNELVLSVGADGTLVKLRDVGRAELGAENYELDVLLNGEPAVGLGVYQRPGSNALETARYVTDALTEMEKTFPPGLKYAIAFDTTLFINASLWSVINNLWQALLLVVLIVFIFLQDWRTTVIPSIAIPVGMIGTFAGMKMLGYDLNTLTLFGLILSAGLGVDDAVVVVDSVLVKIQQGMKPRQAALDSMEELESAVISSSLVLLAVFIPVTFFPGTTGVIYRQFAITIAFTTLFSTFNAITFSPTMAALLLRPRKEMTGVLGFVFGKFNQGFDWVQGGYSNLLNFLVKINPLVIGVFIASLFATYFVYTSVPTGFVPEEDQGYFFVLYSAPDGVSLNYTSEANRQLSEHLKKVPEVSYSLALAGFDFEGQNPSKGLIFCQLKPWSERQDPSQSVYAVLRRLRLSFMQEVPGVRALPVNAPPVQGLSSTGGFEFQLLDQTGNLPISALADNGQRLLAAANSDKYPELQGVFSQFTVNKGQKRVEVKRDLAKTLNVDINTIFGTLQTYFGSSYASDFVLGQKQYRVFVQAEPEYRASVQDISGIYVRSRDNQMIPLANLVSLTDFTGPETITRFNVFRSMKIQGNPGPGFSSGQAIAAMEKAASEVLDPGFGYAWQGSALEEKSAGGAAAVIFGLAFVIVFLVLAAQYESYVDPTIILLVVPSAILGALGAVALRANMMQGSVWPIISNDVYVQIALVMLIAMAAKNSILIVEVARQLVAKGLSLQKAAVQAAVSRFRPIQMTTLSTLIGFWPMVITSGAGASSNWSIGTSLFGGLLMSAILSLLITPNLFIAIRTLESKFLKGEKKPKKEKKDKQKVKSPVVGSEDATDYDPFKIPSSKVSPPVTDQTNGGNTVLQPDDQVNHDQPNNPDEIAGNGNQPINPHPTNNGDNPGTNGNNQQNINKQDNINDGEQN